MSRYTREYGGEPSEGEVGCIIWVSLGLIVLGLIWLVAWHPWA
jgi:hypothetical protein